MKTWLLTLGLVACTTNDTRIHLEVTADPTWGLDHYQLRVGEKAGLASPLQALDVVVPDDMAGKETAFDIWGLVAGQQIAYGMTSVTPALHSTVTVAVTLAPVTCGTWCTEGDVTCDQDGVITCQMQTDGCLAWSAPVACPVATPYCSNGACAAACSDECTNGQTECDSASAVRTCGQFDGDPCLDWSAPMACPGSQSCSNGTCGTQATCAHDGTACDDGNPCTTSDTCEAGTCSGSPKCTTAPPNAMPTCATDGTCKFACMSGFKVSGSTCVPDVKIIFVSSSTQDGALGGLAGADAICQGLATHAGLTGTFKAWLSTTTVSAASRMVHTTKPYTLQDQTVVASDWSHLITVPLAHAVDEDEHGTSVSGLVYTDTNPDGTLTFADDCSGWTVNFPSFFTLEGDDFATDMTWSNSFTSSCSSAGHLYCVEQ